MIKDLPMGILIIVISFFPLSFAYWLVAPSSVLIWIGVIVSIILYYFLFSLGWLIAFTGVNDKEDDRK